MSEQPQNMEKVEQPTCSNTPATQNEFKDLRILTFNCKNILTCGPFFNDILKNMDICLIQEHWLFNCQLHLLNELHEDLIGIGKSVDDNDPIQPVNMPRGHGGVAIIWKKELDSLVNIIDLGNNRIQCIELLTPATKLLLISVYMPCKGSASQNLEFQECIDLLHEITQTFNNSHTILIGGDFNENIMSDKHSSRQLYVLDFMNENEFKTVDVGKTFINAYGQECSSIDFILFSDIN